MLLASDPPILHEADPEDVERASQWPVQPPGAAVDSVDVRGLARGPRRNLARAGSRLLQQDDAHLVRPE